MDANGGNVIRLTQEPLVDGLSAWSPDGKRIAFASNRHGTGDIYLMNAAGGNVERLTHDDTNRSPYDWAPAWSPDGRFIAFESTRGGRGSDIWLMKPDGTKPMQLSKHAGHDTSPAWSPDGKQIAFASRDGKNFTWEIHRIDVDGGNIKNLTNNLANDTRPAWATSGERIAFSFDRDGDYDIYVMKPDGVDVLRLTNHPAGDYAPSWFPNTLAVSPLGKLPTQCRLSRANGRSTSRGMPINVVQSSSGRWTLLLSRNMPRILE